MSLRGVGSLGAGLRLVEARSYASERGHATVSGKHHSPDAKKPNPQNRSTLTDYRKKEVIIKFGFWNFYKSSDFILQNLIML